MKQSKLERKFYQYWSWLGGPELVPEFRFHLKRKWRFDFAHPETKTAFEIHGGIWKGGRHNTGKGMQGDCEKVVEAALHGWKVVTLTAKQITTKNIEGLIKMVRGQIEAANK